MHKLQPTLPCSFSLSHSVASWMAFCVVVSHPTHCEETAFVLIRCCALLLCIFFLFKFNFSALHFLRRPEVRPSRRRKVEMVGRGGRGAWLTRIVYGGRDKQTVCQQLQSAKNVVVVGQIASWQLGDSPLCSLSSLPTYPSSLPRCLPLLIHFRIR